MTEQQRKILIGVGGAATLLALLLVVVLVAGGGGDDDDVATGGSTTSSSSTTTTEALEPVTSATTSSTSSTTPTTAPPPPTTAPPPAAPALNGEGAVLQRPAVTPPRTFDHDQGEGCAELADRGPWKVECEVFSAGDVDLAWMVAEHRGTGALRVYVFRRLVGNQWTVALFAEDEDRVELAGVVARIEDVSGDGRQDVVFGFRHQGTGQILEVDVVEGPGAVTLHRELDKGTATIAPGQLEDWSAQFAADDPNCCPSSFLHSVIRVDRGAWRAVAQEQVGPDRQPPGDF